VVGLVRGVHGLNGALRVEVLTDHPESRFARDATLFREGSDAPLTITDAIAIPDGPGWRIRLVEVADRASAEAFRGVYLEADVDPADGPGRGVYYWHEVVGVPVRGIDGEELGTVVDVYRVAENDVYVVRGGPRGEFDVPAIRDFIRIFTPRRGEIVVDAQALELGPPKPPKPPRPPRPRKGELRPTRPATALPGDQPGDVSRAEPPPVAPAESPSAEPAEPGPEPP
jgi:16S rRNA processing protein RimM